MGGGFRDRLLCLDYGGFVLGWTQFAPFRGWHSRSITSSDGIGLSDSQRLEGLGKHDTSYSAGVDFRCLTQDVLPRTSLSRITDVNQTRDA